MCETPFDAQTQTAHPLAPARTRSVADDFHFEFCVAKKAGEGEDAGFLVA